MYFVKEFQTNRSVRRLEFENFKISFKVLIEFGILPKRKESLDHANKFLTLGISSTITCLTITSPDKAFIFSIF